MLVFKNWKKYYWFIIFSLLLLPISNSFFSNLKNLVKSVITYNEYKLLLNNLVTENKNLNNKVEYYKTSSGIKTLIKERLNKVEDGELIIKFENMNELLD